MTSEHAPGRARARSRERPLRVAFDVTPELAATTGVARYSRELGRALAARGDCELRRFAVGRRIEPVPANTRHLPVPLLAVQASWRLIGLPRAEQLTGSIDVVHSIDLIPPPTRKPLVLTVHDTVAVDFPDLHPERAVAAQRARLERISRAAAVLADSQHTAEMLAGRGVPEDRIVVARPGLTALPDPVDPALPPGPFVLAVGTLEPRKGHELLVRAFAAANVGAHRLVFAGPNAGRAEALTAIGRALGVADRLTILGPVSDAELAALYRGAAVVCMPSLAEGFGLPALEALAHGVPVVASDLPSIREITAGNAILVPAGDVGALAHALERALADRGWRERARDAGPARAARFTWEATAQLAAAAYDRVVSEGGMRRD